MRLLFSIVVCVFACLSAGAQPQFTLSRTLVNVGEIMFQEPKIVAFEFVNTGDMPLQILSVHPSCGCISVVYPQQEVVPGQKGEIQATFDAAMLGVFVKEIEVMTNVADEPCYLVIQGKVTTDPAVSVDDFPIDLDNIRLTTNIIDFGDVNKGEKRVAELQVLNPGRQAYRPLLMHLPPYLTAEYVPQLLAGGRAGRILLHLDSEKVPALGMNYTSIYLARFLGDRIGHENEVAVSAVLLPDFGNMNVTTQVYAPVMEVSTDTLTLEPWGKKTRLGGSIEIRNTGRTSLNISRLQVLNGAITASLSARKIESGAKAKLKISVDRDMLAKDNNPLQVMLITNDPQCAKKVFVISDK